MPKPVDKSIFRSFGYALNGIKYVYNNERNFRFHVYFSIFVILCIFAFHYTVIEACILFMMMCFVLVAEMINSAIEYTWDKLEPNHHPIVGIIKDVMSGSVLVSTLFAVLVGAIIFINHFHSLLLSLL